MKSSDGVWGVFKNEERFGLFFIGALVANLGFWGQNVASVILMYRLTENTALVAMISLFQFASTLLVGPFAGMVADRFDRRKVLMAASTISASAAIYQSVLYLTGTITAPLLLLGVLIFGISNSFHMPSQLAFTPLMVKPAQAHVAISFNASQFNIARSIGPVITSALVIFSNLTIVFLVNAICYAIFLVILQIIKPNPQPRKQVSGNVFGVFKVLQHSNWILALLLAGFLVYGATDFLITLGPALSITHAGDESWAGMYLSFFGVGAASAAILASPFIKDNLFLLPILLLVQGFALVLIAAPLPLWVGLGSAFVYGASFMVTGNRLLSTLQSLVPREELGRISAVWTMFSVGSRVIFAPLEGFLATRFSIPIAGWAIACIFVIAAILLWIKLTRDSDHGRLHPYRAP